MFNKIIIFLAVAIIFYLSIIIFGICLSILGCFENSSEALKCLVNAGAELDEIANSIAWAANQSIYEIMNIFIF